MPKHMTKDNTTFMKWFEKAHDLFTEAEMAAPGWRAARDAYEVGETPETWRDYEKPHWNLMTYAHAETGGETLP